MRRTALIILGAAAGLVALVLIGVAIAVATIDPNRFVAPLAAGVKTATGRVSPCRVRSISRCRSSRRSCCPV